MSVAFSSKFRIDQVSGGFGLLSISRSRLEFLRNMDAKSVIFGDYAGRETESLAALTSLCTVLTAKQHRVFSSSVEENTGFGMRWHKTAVSHDAG